MVPVGHPGAHGPPLLLELLELLELELLELLELEQLELELLELLELELLEPELLDVLPPPPPPPLPPASEPACPVHPPVERNRAPAVASTARVRGLRTRSMAIVSLLAWSRRACNAPCANRRNAGPGAGGVVQLDSRGSNWTRRVVQLDEAGPLGRR